MDVKYVKKTLAEYIKKGEKKFVIYPYGENGRIVKNILWDYFDIEPVAIVDNNYCRFNNKIQSSDKFLENYDQESYVIITIENEKIRNEIKSQLLDYNVKAEKIISVFKKSEPRMEKLENQLALYNILPHREKNSVKAVKRKIKIRILYESSVLWNTLERVASAFRKDTKYDLKIIVINQIKSNEIDCIEKHLKEFSYIWEEEYKIEIDQPDIFTLSHLYSKHNLDTIRYFSKFVIFISAALLPYTSSLDLFWQHRMKNVTKYNPDYYLFDSFMYHKLKEYGYESKKLVEMGNAKYDGIYEANQNKNLPMEWTKLKGKKIVSWITDHGVYGEIISSEISFDIYAKSIFRYFEKHPDMGLIFRPHFNFLKELERYNIWSKEDFREFRAYCEASPNIIFDETLSYDIAYACSDGIIMDMCSGTTLSALPLLKPVCITYRSRERGELFHEEVLSNYYSAYDKSDILDFIEIVKQDKDLMFDLRKEASKKYVKHFDGKNGQRIKDFIEEKYLEEIKRVF